MGSERDGGGIHGGDGRDGGDDERMARFAQRDRLAARELWQRYHPRVAARAARLLGGNRDDAKDVTQLAFEKLFLAAPTWKPGASVLSWLLEVAKNDALKRRREQARFLEPSRREDESGEPVEADERADAALLARGQVAPPAVEVMEDWQRQVEVRAAVASLPAAQREAIDLVYYQGLTAAEAAEKADVPARTMESRVRLAIEKLAQRLRAIAARRRHEPGAADRDEEDPEGQEEGEAP